MSERKKVWGLYDTDDGSWLVDESDAPQGKAWKKSPVVRTRFDNARQAQACRKRNDLHDGIVPRPFYIVSKSKLPDDVLELVRAAKAWFVHDKEDQFGCDEARRFVRAVRALDGKY